MHQGRADEGQGSSVRGGHVHRERDRPSLSLVVVVLVRDATSLAPSMGEEAAARLHLAMLRDTTDGLLDVAADGYLVVGPPELSAHVHPPWELVAGPPDHGSVLFVRSDSPTLLTEPLRAARDLLADRGRAVLVPGDGGGWCALGLPGPPHLLEGDVRARAAALGLAVTELEPCYAVDAPAAVNRLVAELKRHPERAPRSADFFVRGAW